MLGAVQYYPRTLAEMEEWFATDEACQSYLVKLRWADGIRCARCHSSAHWETKRGLTMCGRCGYQQSVTAGTIFHRSHLPLRLWFRVQQLDYYLDEFTFRFNRRTSRHRGKLFYRLAQQAVAIEPSPYSDLVASRRNHNI